MKRFFVVDEEKNYSDLVCGCAKVKGYEPFQFFDASSAYRFFSETPFVPGSDILWIDMYLLPGAEGTFHPVRKMHDEYRVGLRLAKRLIEDEIIAGDAKRRVWLYTGHSTKQLWAEIDKFCDESGFQKFRKKASDSVEDILGRII